MEILNLDERDYHMHSLNFSDWANTIDEIVKFAWEIWMKEIAITDHSTESIKVGSSVPPSSRWHSLRWKNIHNNVNVIFWVEWDILNEEWDCCLDINWTKSDFVSLSLHEKVFNWDFENVNIAYENAIKRYHDKIKFICHPCLKRTSMYLDVKKLCEIANEYNIPLEINWAWLMSWKMNLDKHSEMLKYWNRFYINSDAHNLYEIKEARKFAINYLKENWYIK